MVKLARAFLAHARARKGDAAAPELEQELERLFAASRAAWPGVDVETDTFLRHLAERLPPGCGDDLVQALGQMHATDLYLACACSSGDARALEAFDKHLMSEVPLFLLPVDARPAFADEVKQALRVRLFVREAGLAPRIASYTGRGPLGGWLRMAAARAAVDLQRAAKAARPDGDPADPLPDVRHPEPELAYLKSHYAEEFQAAFEETLLRLEPREATILQLYFFEGMTGPQVAKLYRVTPRSAQRWIGELRQKILDAIHHQIRERLGISNSQIASFLGILQTELGGSLQKFLKRTDE